MIIRFHCTRQAIGRHALKFKERISRDDLLASLSSTPARFVDYALFAPKEHETAASVTVASQSGGLDRDMAALKGGGRGAG
jgi:hypothetical protein